MKRRDALGLLGAAAVATPIPARAAGALMAALWPFAEGDPEGQALSALLRQRLRELGQADLAVESRWSEGKVERTRVLAAELVRSNPDVIFAYFNAQLSALSKETRTIPIVFVGASDPVGAGYVESLPRPGGNVTGFTLYQASLAGKWLALLRGVSPNLKRVALLVNPDTAVLRGTFYVKALEAAAGELGIEPVVAKVTSPDELDGVVAALGQTRASGLIVAPDTFSEANGDRIVALSTAHRVPAIFAIRRFARRGGLMSYGPDPADAVRRAADYVDRILRGEKPAFLPVQAPTKYAFIVNLDTARALGLEVGPSVLAQADEIVE